MLSESGFNLWADGYDKSVGLSDEDRAYPFAGYKNLLNEIYNRVLSAPGKTVLDIGFGTGTFTARLYEQGCSIFGQDFSERMIELAQAKMPEAKLYQGDFASGLAEPLKRNKYDAIIATYSLHHLTDAQKIGFLEGLLTLLNKGGHIYVGDVAFKTRAELEECKAKAGDEWDDDEIYFVFDELTKAFPQMEFERFSFCAGLLSMCKPANCREKNKKLRFCARGFSKGFPSVAASGRYRWKPLWRNVGRLELAAARGGFRQAEEDQ